MSQTILVTGASAGIGLATSQYLLSLPQQHRVILCCNSNDKPLKALANDSSNSNRVFIVKGDVSDPKFVETVLAQSLLHFEIDRIDAVVLNHGTLGSCKRIADVNWDEWESVMRVNVGSYVAIVSPRSRKKRRGSDLAYCCNRFNISCSIYARVGEGSS